MSQSKLVSGVLTGVITVRLARSFDLVPGGGINGTELGLLGGKEEEIFSCSEVYLLSEEIPINFLLANLCGEERGVDPAAGRKCTGRESLDLFSCSIPWLSNPLVTANLRGLEGGSSAELEDPLLELIFKPCTPSDKA